MFTEAGCSVLISTAEEARQWKEQILAVQVTGSFKPSGLFPPALQK